MYRTRMEEMEIRIVRIRFIRLPAPFNATYVQRKQYSMAFPHPALESLNLDSNDYSAGRLGLDAALPPDLRPSLRPRSLGAPSRLSLPEACSVLRPSPQ